MAPKRTTRLNPATTPTPATTTTITSVTNAQLQAMIDQGVTAALAVRDVNRSTNGEDNHNSGTGMEKMEIVFCIRHYSMENQIKFLTCTLLGNALTWWNSHVRTIGNKIAYAMTWTELKKNMTEKYCSRTEIKKLKVELWNLKVKGTDVIGYNQNFQELALLCVRMFLEESDKIERIPTNAITANNQRGTRTRQWPTCFECGVQGHYKRECPKLTNNNNRVNPARNANAPAKVYAVGHVGTNPDSNIVMGTFLLNNHYASILFDMGTDRSFVSTAFSSQIDITPTALDHYYDVKLADGRIIGLNTILMGCALNFLNHPFNINLKPVELGSFDAIIRMDWLARYQAVIVCVEKIVRIPW
ncbi:reverse transcriptase domain-containing protein [Tanacetum coccineum]